MSCGTGICMCLTGNGRLACTHRLCRDEIFRLCRVLLFEGSRIQAGATEVGLRESCEGCVCVCVCDIHDIVILYSLQTYSGSEGTLYMYMYMGVNLLTGYNNTSSTELACLGQIHKLGVSY